jgi:urease accessory protein UreF
MFSLEQSMMEWRRRMLAAGIKSPVPLEELESHLREAVEQQMRSGSDARTALTTAVQEMGQVVALKSEFNKVERKQMKRTLMISLGVIGVLVGMAFVMPAVAQYKHEGAMSLNEVCLLLLGLGMTIGGGSVAAFSFRKRNA